MKLNRPITQRWLTCGHGEVWEAVCPTSHRLNGGLFCLDHFHSNTVHNKNTCQVRLLLSYTPKHINAAENVTDVNIYAYVNNSAQQATVKTILLFLFSFLPLRLITTSFSSDDKEMAISVTNNWFKSGHLHPLKKLRSSHLVAYMHVHAASSASIPQRK